jgi:hypothetical protein
MSPPASMSGLSWLGVEAILTEPSLDTTSQAQPEPEGVWGLGEGEYQRSGLQAE